MQQRPKCPACNGDGKTLFSCHYKELSALLGEYYRRAMPRIDGHYRIERCGICGTYWQGEAPNSELLTEVYDRWLGEGEPEAVRDPLSTRDGHEILALQSYFRRKSVRVLDFGSGLAAWARTAKSLGCETYAVDLSTAAMQVADAHGIGSDHGELDYINMEQVLEHLADPAREIARLSQFLVPNGVLKVSVPSPKGVPLGIEKLKRRAARHADIMAIWPLEHLNCFTREGLRRLGSRFGLETFKPSWKHRYAFLRAGRAGSLKEVIRPEYQWVASNNIYTWFRKAAPAA